MVNQQRNKIISVKNFQSANPSSLKKIVSYSQVCHISNFFTETNKMTKYPAGIKKAFFKWGYQEASEESQFSCLNDKKNIQMKN